MNLAAMRAENSIGRVAEFVAKRGDELPWFDQDALNVIAQGRWLSLHPRWNTQNSFWLWRDWAREVHGADRITEATQDPAILHFEGPSVCKPWHYLSRHPFRQRYLEELSETPWNGQPLMERTISNRVISHLPARAQLPAYGWVHRSQARLSTGVARLRAK
jgi:lipopolysaccharide biosynthesis glycosyltransferase